MANAVTLTKADLKALTVLVNDGICCSDVTQREEKRALAALAKIADALDVKHEVHGGTFRVSL